MKQNIGKINKVYEVLSIVFITFAYFSCEKYEALGTIQITVYLALIVTVIFCLCRFCMFFGIKYTLKII